MRMLAARLNAYLRRSTTSHAHSRNFSSSFSKGGVDEAALEEEAERKIGWLLKAIFAGTAAAVGYQFFPYMGDNVMQQSVSLLQVKDPFFKRQGAYRLARFATDDERRLRIVEMGGAQHLVTMLEAAKDDRTRKEALKALAALSLSADIKAGTNVCIGCISIIERECGQDEAVGALHQAGALSAVKSTLNSVEEAEIEEYRTSLLKRFEDLRNDSSP